MAGMLPTIGGLCALMVVMGVGRFAYTALLPGMMHTYGFGEDVAGIMAAWNYAGYLIGAVAVRWETPGPRRYVFFALSLLLSVATTAGMGSVTSPAIWHAIRFLSGFASGACFVLCSSIVLDTLAMVNRPALAGLLYSGVGAGIAMGGLVSGPMESVFGVSGAWRGIAVISIPFAAVALAGLRPGANRAHLERGKAKAATVSAGNDSSKFVALLFAYFLEGFGYIIGATFLVTLVQGVTNSPETAKAAWVVTGCAAAVTAPLWRFAAGKAYAPAIVKAFVLQGVGMLLPVLSVSVFAAFGGGLLLGGTFMGLSVLCLQYGVMLSGKPSARTIALMTVVYGVGQIIGPIVVAATAGKQGFGPAFIISAASLFVAAGIVVIFNGKNSTRRKRCPT